MTREGINPSSLNADKSMKIGIQSSDGERVDTIPTNGYTGLVTLAPAHISKVNSTVDPTSDALLADAIFMGEWEDIANFGVIVISVTSDVASAVDGLMVQQSSDATVAGILSDDVYTVAAGAKKTFGFQTAAKFYRIVYTNGGSDQTVFNMQTVLKPYYVKPSSHRIQDSIIDDDDAELMKAVTTYADFDGVFVNTASTKPLPVIDLNGISIARGDITGFSNIQKFGHNEAVGTTLQTMWSQSTLYTYPVSATIMTVSSSDVNDDNGDTGAWTVEVFGLDTDYNEINEIVILDGQDEVATQNEYLRVNRAIVRTAGTSGWNEGSIYVGTGLVSSGVPANIFTIIDPTDNQTLQAFYTIPAGKTGYLTLWNIAVGTGKELEAKLVARPFGEVFQVKQELHLFEVPYTMPFSVPLKFLEKTDIEVRALLTTAPAVAASSSFDLTLIDN